MARKEGDIVPEGAYVFLEKLYESRGGQGMVIIGKSTRRKPTISLQKEINCDGDSTRSCMVLGIGGKRRHGELYVSHAHITSGNRLDSGGTAIVKDSGIEPGLFSVKRMVGTVKRRVKAS